MNAETAKSGPKVARVVFLPDSFVVQAGLPTVVVETWKPGAEIDSVVQDGFGGGLLAAAHMISCGHKSFGWLGLNIESGNPLIVDRHSGVTGGLAPRRMKLSREVTALNREDNMREAALKLLAGSNRPTAIFALWQSATKGLTLAARELGLTIGKEFEMVGWSYDTLFGPVLLADRKGLPADNKNERTIEEDVR